MRVAPRLGPHHVPDEVRVRVAPLAREPVAAEDRGAGIGREVALDVLLRGVDADRCECDREGRRLTVERHLHALGADGEPDTWLRRRSRSPSPVPPARQAGRRSQLLPTEHEPCGEFRSVARFGCRAEDTTYTGRGLGRWLSGRKRPPAKRVRDVKSLRGFESPPSRQASSGAAAGYVTSEAAGSPQGAGRRVGGELLGARERR